MCATCSFRAPVLAPNRGPRPNRSGAADRREALTRAKKGDAVKGKTCGDAAVKSQYELGSDLGVEGTPAIFTQTGDYIGGYVTPAELVQAIQETQKAAVAAR